MRSKIDRDIRQKSAIRPKSSLVTDRATSMPENGLVQMKCTACEEEKLQMKPISSSIAPMLQMQSEENKGVGFCTEDPFLDMSSVREAIHLAFHMSINARDYDNQMYEEWAEEGSTSAEMGTMPLHRDTAPDYKEAFFRVEEGQISPIKLSSLALNISSNEHGITDNTQAFFHTHPTQKRVSGRSLKIDKRSGEILKIPIYTISEKDIYVINSPTSKNRWRRNQLDAECLV